MREIKFRAWDTDKKEMIYNVGLETSFLINGQSDLCITHPYYSSYDPYYITCDGVEQYTGLKDKNGKEIYEGDIVKNPLYEELYVVEYYIPLAVFVGWGNDRACGCYLITDEDIEIIGNIHESPELLA